MHPHISVILNFHSMIAIKLRYSQWMYSLSNNNMYCPIKITLHIAINVDTAGNKSQCTPWWNCPKCDQVVFYNHDIMSLVSNTANKNNFFCFLPEFLQSQQGWRSRQQASSQRISCHGLEMKSELVWERWEPNKEFTKTLVLKNVHRKLQKLNVRSYKHFVH